MFVSTLQRLGRNAFEASSVFFGPPLDAHVQETRMDLRHLKERLRAAQALARPGFMVLHAVREAGCIVDFEWDYASLLAMRWLRGSTRDSGRDSRRGDLHSLIGESLVEALAGRPAGAAVFDQYRRVVECGAAHAVQQPVERHHVVEVLHHAAVRLHDGVAVRLSNLSAVRREVELRRAIRACSLVLGSSAPA